ncbi:ACP S-malonyltransferase [Amycolatopsis jiangsuensis]|uniref:[acyl-carrier-protein] S-malonyltransferase n=1 Tax=Amycolatopsis jiangsuensis TaxID=1181879 RepID=A0A840IS08_9PSEU|nr:acyltransferase domain-containing protein [Amycolatopsis jiangsuensis]MBB4683804.1 [acyl-carrier-protein] S-malonyltransferase [Amycolatopsis jiangsuensis]
MDKTADAVLFPGMGPARAGMLGRFLVIDHRARRLLGVAERALRHSLLDPLAREDDEYTEHTQLAFVLASLAVAERAEQEHDLDPVAVGGASFGERAAVVRAGALPLADLVRLVAEVARRERAYFERAHQDLVSQFVVRTPEAVLTDVLDGIGHELSGRFDAEAHLVTLAEHDLGEFVRRVRAAGGYALTTMRPAAHARVLGPLRDELAEVFGRFGFADPALPIVSDQDGEPVRTGDEAAALLLESTVNAVRLPELVHRFARLGVGRVLVAGPDHLLHRLPGLTGQFTLLRADVREALTPRRRPRLTGAVAA